MVSNSVPQVRPSKLLTPHTYQHYARITAQITFPVDMLRYDSCYPCGVEDTAVIAQTWQSGGGGVVHVCAITASPVPPWTIGRWESFLCTCEPINASDAP